MECNASYAYLDKSERSRPGEKWKDIPGFEGYRISNHGRVRSVDRIVPHNRCGTQFVKGRILSQNIKKHYNHFTKDYVYILQTTLMLENIRYDKIVRRLLYGTFKDRNFLATEKKMIVAKDNDGLNNNLSNLIAIDNSEKQKRIIQRGRIRLILAELDHTKFKPTFSLWKPVHRCTIEGKIIETYPCISHAAQKEGFYEKGIIMAAKGQIKTYKGFKWKYASRKILKPIIKTWSTPKV